MEIWAAHTIKQHTDNQKRNKLSQAGKIHPIAKVDGLSFVISVRLLLLSTLAASNLSAMRSIPFCCEKIDFFCFYRKFPCLQWEHDMLSIHL
ncbi:MAG: hypothetical protein AAF900_02245 [Bacteroidota bacterium]